MGAIRLVGAKILSVSEKMLEILEHDSSFREYEGLDIYCK